jgi:hypothetical protein
MKARVTEVASGMTAAKKIKAQLCLCGFILRFSLPSWPLLTSAEDDSLI